MWYLYTTEQTTDFREGKQMESRRTETVSDRYVVVRGWVPQWVERVGAPVWVSDLNHKIVYLNHRAEELLGKPAGGCVGNNCYQIIRGKLANGKSFCNARCEVVKNFQFGKELEPIRLRVGIGRRSRWVQIVLIPVQAPDLSGPRLVHCVVDDDRTERFARYLTRVVSRTPRSRFADRNLTAYRLTDREREILELLADDRSPHEIAEALHLSYSTVRNHVQHILSKLGVHSITEAVACYLLSYD